MTSKTNRKPSTSRHAKLQTLLSTAVRNHKAGRFKEAEQGYRRILALTPDADVSCNLGVVLKEQNRHDEAAATLRSAIALNPGHAVAHYNLGNVFKDRKMTDEAIASYRRAITANPGYAAAHFNLGNLLRARGMTDDAAASYNKAIAINPAHAGAYNNLGRMLKDLGRFDETIECFRRVTTIHPGNADAHYNAGVAFKSSGDVKEATESYRRAILVDSDHALAHYNLGNALREQGMYEDAAASYRRAIELDDNNLSAKHLLAALTGHTTQTAPRQYIVDMYDTYSKTFDNHLVDKLGYKIPGVLRGMFTDLFEGRPYFRNVVDLGCGTGLSGEEFRSVSDRLSGVDLSSGMIEAAKGRNVYDVLHIGDIVEFLDETSEQYDLFVATDVCIYIGDMGPFFTSIDRCSTKGARLAFSTETLDRDGYALRPTGRYAHSRGYILSSAAKHNFVEEMIRPEIIRKEGDEEIPGDVFIMRHVS